MKLSEAIRLGALLRPQRSDGDMVGDEGSCALGAAAEAAGLCSEGNQRPYTELRARFPILNLAWAKGTLLQRIYELNDACEWTREQIADWVATIEAQQEPAALANTSTVEVSAANELVVK